LGQQARSQKTPEIITKKLVGCDYLSITTGNLKSNQGFKDFFCNKIIAAL